MDTDLHQALNNHLQLEFGAAHNYLANALWFEEHNLPGFAGWMRRQSSEETDHAHRFINHLLERDLKVMLPEIPKPRGEWETAHDVIKEVLLAEQRVTESINLLYDLAEKASDRAAVNLLQWFISEQLEEEAMVRALIGRLELVGTSGLGLLLIDQELGRGVVVGAPEEPASGQA